MKLCHWVGKNERDKEAIYVTCMPWLNLVIMNKYNNSQRVQHSIPIIYVSYFHFLYVNVIVIMNRYINTTHSEYNIVLQ